MPVKKSAPALAPERKPTVSEPAARIVGLSGVDLNVRNIAAMELPARLFGKKRFQAGDQISLASALLAHARAYRVGWEGSFTLLEKQ